MTKIMKVGLITTLETNIGDDLIREGVIRILRASFPDRQFEFAIVNKHRPLEVYPPKHPARWFNFSLRKLRLNRRFWTAVSRVGSRVGPNRFADCDLIAQCGAPVMYEQCHRSEWAGPLWHDTVRPLHQRVPVINIAAGSCYSWEHTMKRIEPPADATFIRTIGGYCRLTTARDRLYQDFAAIEGLHTPLVPCSAFLALSGTPQDQAGPAAGKILLNYMSSGGHFDMGQGVDPQAWEATMRGLIEHLRPNYPLAMLCHNQREYDLAAEIAPDLPRIWPRKPEEYASAVAGCIAAVCNRLHAAVGIAGMGVPVIAIGNDTRLLMVAELGVPCYYVKDATVENLSNDLDRLLATRQNEVRRLLQLQSETLGRYVTLVRAATAL